MGAIDYLADRQAVWSATADRLKRTVDRARTSTFGLSVGGALAAAVATTELAAPVRPWLTGIGAAALAIAAFLSARFLTREALSRHVRARSASEALKRDAYLYATGSGPYADPAAKDAHLAAEQARIEDGVSDLGRFEAPASGKGSCPRGPLSSADYVAKRLQGQIDYYRKRADGYAGKSRLLHAAEWLLALAAAVLTALAGVIGKSAFDPAAIAPVLTTVGGTVLAHLQASRYDELVSAYRATARRLGQLEQATPPGTDVSALATACEDILADETKSWLAMWSK